MNGNFQSTFCHSMDHQPKILVEHSYVLLTEVVVSDFSDLFQ